MRLTIAKKLLAAYLLMACLTILVGSYAIFSLQELNEITYSILKKDFLIIYHGRQMIDNLLAQERTEKKFIILKAPSLEELFWNRSRDLKESIKKLKKIDSPETAQVLSQVQVLHDECDVLFRREAELIKANHSKEAAQISESPIKDKTEAIAVLLNNLQTKAERDVDAKMKLISMRGIRASGMTTALCLISLCGGIALAVFITYTISRPLKKLKKATGFIGDGNFDYDDLHIGHNDEIGDLARRFRMMAGRLKVLEQLNLDASPLTRLPGNIAIEQHIERRLSEGKRFSLCHVDLDNFKPFADKYGYAWASEVIKEVANILAEAVKSSGEDGDFIGHIGGDDFIIITHPERSENICQQVIDEFDRRVLQFYEEKDKQEGFIIGKDRRGNKQQFPLLTISIGIVTDDGSRYSSPVDMARTAAEVKEFAKTHPASNYVKQEDMLKH
ncbi:MAG: diguanylate cyclase [Proteobacteria bacterium]|nr:diguanylate cyclase [Pseudomonadota bacterium]